MRKAIGVAIIKNGCILLVCVKKVWILPGGKPEVGESNMQCLFREIQEELPQLILQKPEYFGTFVGTAPHKGYELGVEVYIAKASGEITPDAEIDQAEWVKNPEVYNLSEITRKIVLSLRQKGHL